MKKVFTVLLSAMLLSGCAHRSSYGQAQRNEAPCESMIHADMPYTVCTIDLSEQVISLHLNRSDGTRIGQPALLAREFAEAGTPIQFAMNGGMYHADRRPVGLYVEEGVTLKALVRGDGPGNFQLLPNGVFWISEDVAAVTETEAYAALDPTPRFATQSGPMLVIDGDLHPAFNADSESVYRRNGVGVDEDGRVYMAISERPVSLYAFASLFRDGLNTPNALYLDGKVSRLIIPSEDRFEFGLDMGPILVVRTSLDVSTDDR